MQGTIFKEGDCMSLEGFCTCIRLGIQKKLGSRFQVEVREITKNNDTKLEGLIIMEQGASIHPTIYMDDFYDRHRKGESLEKIEDRILQIYEDHRTEGKFDITFFSEWKTMKDKVIYKLISLDRNRELLKEAPHRKILDLAVVYEYFLGMDGKCGASILVRNDHMETWGVTADELYAAAFSNTPKLMGCNFYSMKEVRLGIMGSGAVGPDGIENLPSREELEKDIFPMYVLTNRYRLHGAGCIIYKGLLKKIAEIWDCDICIIPSSIHETILMPMSAVGSCEAISKMVREVNQTQVSPEEILSDHVYQFSRKTGETIMWEEEEYE